MSLDLLALVPGQTSTSGSLDALLGRERSVEDLTLTSPGNNGLAVTGVRGTSVLKLVKASSTLTATPGACIGWNSGDPTANTVTAVAAAAADTATVAGFALLPSGTTSVAAGTYFWVVRRGPVAVTTNGAVTATTRLAVHSTAGALDDTTVTSDTNVANSMASTSGAAVTVVYATLS